MKNLMNILSFVVGTAFAVVLIWSFLYLCIPNVKDGTDKLFKWGDYQEVVKDEEKTEDEPKAIAPNTNAQFVFENDMIKITVG